MCVHLIREILFNDLIFSISIEFSAVCEQIAYKVFIDGILIDL